MCGVINAGRTNNASPKLSISIVSMGSPLIFHPTTTRLPAPCSQSSSGMSSSGCARCRPIDRKAEAIAFVVSKAVGLETGIASADYINFTKATLLCWPKVLQSSRKHRQQFWQHWSQSLSSRTHRKMKWQLLAKLVRISERTVCAVRSFHVLPIPVRYPSRLKID